MGYVRGGTITYNCDVCGQEKTTNLYNYNRSKHHFCSKNCRDIFNSNTYGCKEGYSKCSRCKTEKQYEEFANFKSNNGSKSYIICKVCDYFRRHKDIKIAEGWTKEEYVIILDNLLNKKVNNVNELVDKLNNKTIEQIAILLRDTLIIKGRVKIAFNVRCKYCNNPVELKLYRFLDKQLHFCSAKCNTKYYGEIKSVNTPKHKRICQLEECKNVFYVDSSRVNAGKDKFCSPECSQKSQMVMFKGKNNPNWQGGISELYQHLRRSIKQWKEDSIKECNYKCILTGSRFNDVHHLYNFENIIKETLYELHLPIKEKISMYSDIELLCIENKCLEIHYRYPLGVCIKRELHILFHSLYGRDNNTIEQFEEFISRYYSGEFKNYYKNLIAG